MKRHSGFTLIEVLVAMFVFAIAGGLAAMSLHSMVCSNQLLKTKENTLLQLQITMTTLRRDIAQIIDRPVIGASMHLEPAIAASGQGDLAFTRTGVLLQQTHMQRVAYRLVGDRLEKLIWQTLDQSGDVRPEKQVILHGVQSLQWQFVASNGYKSERWQPVTGSNLDKNNTGSKFPKAILMVMKVRGEGVVQGIFPVVSQGDYATS